MLDSLFHYIPFNEMKSMLHPPYFASFRSFNEYSFSFLLLADLVESHIFATFLGNNVH